MVRLRHSRRAGATLGATEALTTAKHDLRDWVESQLIGAPQSVDTRAFAAALHVAFGDANLLCLDMAGDCATNVLGYVDDVRVDRAGEFLSVVTAVGINCGYDESAYAYTWRNGRWQRFWESEQNSYTKDSYRPQQVHDVLISASGAGGRRLLATLGSQSGCTGGFKDLYARAWQLDAALGSTRVLDWTAYADDGYPPIQGRIRPDDLLVQYTTGGLADGDTHTAVRHFEIRNGAAVQIDPIAGRPHDFVLEWLSAPWEDSRTRAASEALREAHTSLHLEHPYVDLPEPTRICTAGADLWQVGTRTTRRPDALLPRAMGGTLPLHDGGHQRDTVSGLHGPGPAQRGLPAVPRSRSGEHSSRRRAVTRALIHGVVDRGTGLLRCEIVEGKWNRCPSAGPTPGSP